MAFKTLILERHNEIAKAPIGFSWTTLFFSFLVPLFRGDFIWFAGQLICSILTSGLSSIIFAFIYNKIYVKQLYSEGYSLSGQDQIQTMEEEIRIKNYIGRKVL